ncbi:fumarylacetoacetate hydrolase family protein [Bythopirellula polymerisocia]|uniref:Ureidoglycolate lyase n=1 Tax=Bythopirellula polymerisocia TaxID=2528003 RepID=A0A5C6CWR5_9BACT|nr:fumarylacetoacetate hydrolase family protein [Bythopirellula polymerisocia]TWU27861.1 Ureidoglycolate lyase [Bythopirellula polymerisocia]
MKLLRYGEPGKELPGVLDPDGQIRSLANVLPDLSGEALCDESLQRLRKQDFSALPLVEQGMRLGPCVAGTSKIIGIGLNYADHAAETGAKVPTEPVLFMKATTSISGPNDPIEIPRDSEKTDWEVELGVIIGKRAKYVTEQDAISHVAGYCVVNDVSERSFQKDRCGTWDKGKGCDTFAPLGPWLVTRDEVPDPQDLLLWLEVDGHRYQNGSTSTMIFGVKSLVSYVSQFMTLVPGDIITTGTPPGVGMGQQPNVFLRPGQTVRLGVESLGEQDHQTVAAK